MTKFTWANDVILMVDKLWEAQNYVEGRAVLEDILFEEPGYALAHSYAGWYALYHTKNLKEAQMHFEYALRFDPSIVPVYIHYADLCLRTRDEKTLYRLIRMSESYELVDTASLINDLGRLQETQGEYRSAARTYKRAVEQTMNNQAIEVILANRKRVVRKHKLFGAWYSWML